MGEIAILHAADARAFSCRMSSELAAEGHSVLRREGDAAHLAGQVDPAVKADAVVVVWSPGMLENATVIEAARRALARRALAPVRIGGAEPPASFAHLWPIDLDGWSGDTADPRWQFVRDEIALAMRRSEIALSTAQISRPPAIRRAAPARAEARWRKTGGKLAAAPLRLIAPGAFGLAAIATVAVVMTAQQSNSNAAPREAPPMVAYVEAIAPPAEATPSLEYPIEIPAPPLRADGAETGVEAGGGQSAVPPRVFAEAEVSSAAPDAFASPDAPFTDEAGEPVAPEDAVGGPEMALAEAQSIEEIGPPGAEPAASIPATPAAPTPSIVATPTPPADAYAGLVFRDCVDCPDMTSAAGVALSRREITYDQWSACVREKACRHVSDAGFGRGARPVINISYEDAGAYVDWLTSKTGWRYRLPSEAEWALAAAAEPVEVTPGTVNYAGGPWNAPLPAGSFAASSNGLYDMRGNVWEWTADCALQEGETCKARILKGGAYDAPAEKLASAARLQRGEKTRAANIGFRVAREAP